MSLLVELKIDKTTLLAQEDTSFEVIITNMAPKPVEIVRMANVYTLPAMKVSAHRGGWERVFQSPPSMFHGELTEPLPPKQSASYRSMLLNKVKFPAPGE